MLKNKMNFDIPNDIFLGVQYCNLCNRKIELCSSLHIINSYHVLHISLLIARLLPFCLQHWTGDVCLFSDGRVYL